MFFKTSDMGITWTILNTPVPPAVIPIGFNSVHFFNSLTGFIAGGGYDPISNTVLDLY